MNDSIMVQATNIHHAYQNGGVAENVLHGVDLTIQKGEFVVIMGQSGCGKTTLLNILGLMMSPTRADTVKIDGQETAGLTDGQRTKIRRQTLGFVFQRFNLLPTVNIRQNVALPLKLNGQSANGTVDELLDRVGLTDYRHKKPGQLSIGQQQRVAIARALIANPALLLADEPTGNLDSTNANAVLSLLQDFHQQSGQTILLITHNEHLAINADRVLQMKDGRFCE